MKLEQRLSGRIKVNHPKTDEVFWIAEVEDGVFTVKSSKGVDSYGNGLPFTDIRKAFSYIETHIKNN